MAFIQIIEHVTSRIDEVRALADEFRATRAGDTTATRTTVAKDRDSENRYLLIVEFPSYEEAMRNSEDPRTSEFAEKLAALMDEPPTYRNLDVIDVMDIA